MKKMYENSQTDLENGESYLEKRLRELIIHSLTEQKQKRKLMAL